jgi:small-conductance mechanosensitive channel
VEKITIEAAKGVMKEVPGGVPEFVPFTRYHTFSDFSVNFSVIMRAKEVVDQYLIKHEFVKRLQRRYMKEGIVIPVPITPVHMKESVGCLSQADNNGYLYIACFSFNK